jgi:ubiquinone/menaquinone biosynthesis C-methylase UbiE
MSDPFFEPAPYYALRAPYVPQALEYVRDEFHLDKSSRVLDLGCGPGTLTIPLSRFAGEVLAIDPSEAMMSQGRSRGGGNITWLCMRAEEVSESLGTFNVVTLGQSFHWMDRDRVLRQLATMIRAGGGLALVNPGKRRPQESWEPIADEVIARYLGPRPRHSQKSPELEHEPSLLRSAAFSRFTAREFAMDFERTVPSIIGHTYSLSSSPKSAFGDRLAQFEQDLTAALLQVNPSGVFKEHLETEVLIAR